MQKFGTKLTITDLTAILMGKLQFGVNKVIFPLKKQGKWH